MDVIERNKIHDLVNFLIFQCIFGGALIFMAFIMIPLLSFALWTGVDFIAGPTDIKLKGKVSGNGKPIWVTYFLKVIISILYPSGFAAGWRPFDG